MGPVVVVVGPVVVLVGPAVVVVELTELPGVDTPVT